MMPSRPMTSRRSSQWRAVARSVVVTERVKRFATSSSLARLSARGRACTASPSQSSTSNAMYVAGVSAESLRIRDSAGCRRICIASKSRRPSRSMTISPSSAECGGNSSPSGRSSGKYRSSGRPLRLQSASSPLSFSSTPRKPSHFGSYCHCGPVGIASTSSASCGGNGTFGPGTLGANVATLDREERTDRPDDRHTDQTRDAAPVHLTTHRHTVQREEREVSDPLWPPEERRELDQEVAHDGDRREEHQGAARSPHREQLADRGKRERDEHDENGRERQLRSIDLDRLRCRHQIHGGPGSGTDESDSDKEGDQSLQDHATTRDRRREDRGEPALRVVR